MNNKEVQHGYFGMKEGKEEKNGRAAHVVVKKLHHLLLVDVALSTTTSET